MTILARALERAAPQAVVDRLVPLLVGATVFAFALGSSSVPSLTRIGHPLRWIVLVALLLAAVPWARVEGTMPSGVAMSAAALVGLAVLSTGWSVEPRTTFEKAVSLGLLFAVAGLLALGVRGRPERAASVLTGVLGGAVVVGLVGFALLAFAHGRAVQPATYQEPARFKGLGQDPNTVALLFAVVLPIAAWRVLRPGRRAVAVAALLVLLATIVASGSRGAVVAAAAGSLVMLAAGLRRPRPLLAGAAVVVVLAGAGVVVQSLPKPATLLPPVPPAHTGPTAKPGYANAEESYPLAADVGQPLPGGGQPPVNRTLFGSSGRAEAWTGALHEVWRRPIAGHGFGTEAAVFVDRYYRFVGGLPENSYIGLALQLGAVGLLALLALVAALGRSGWTALRTGRRDLAAASIGVLAAGLVAGVVQSYFYSVGNIAAAALWIPAFLLAGVGDG